MNRHPTVKKLLADIEAYLDKTGTPALDPITLPELKENLAAPRYEDFEVRAVQQPVMGAAA